MSLLKNGAATTNIHMAASYFSREITKINVGQVVAVAAVRKTRASMFEQETWSRQIVGSAPWKTTDLSMNNTDFVLSRSIIIIHMVKSFVELQVWDSNPNSNLLKVRFYFCGTICNHTMPSNFWRIVLRDKIMYSNFCGTNSNSSFTIAVVYTNWL